MENSKVLVLIPTLNEAAAIRKVIEDTHIALRLHRIDYEIVVADGGSTDGTVQIVQQMKERLLPVPKGKGNGVREALGLLDLQSNIYPELRYDYLFMLDGDGTYPPTHIPFLLQCLLPTEEKNYDYMSALGKQYNTQYDVVCGRRQFREPGAMTRVNLFGNVMLTVLADLVYWPAYTGDLCTGLWGFRRSAIERLSLSARRFELEADLFANAAKLNMRIGCWPIVYRARIDGDRPKLKVRDGGRIAWHLLRERFK
jgi:glycosyltransferase involved in cell wall biosynthesis